MSEWASIQSTPPGPCTDASPPSVPSATEWSPPRTSGVAPASTSSTTFAAIRSHVALISGQEARALVVERRRLGHRRLDVPVVSHVVAKALQTLLEARVADRRRPHVDAAAALPEVERRTDDRDLALSPFVTAEPTTRDAATLGAAGEVAQLVEHTAENRGVAGSSPALATRRVPFECCPRLSLGRWRTVRRDGARVPLGRRAGAARAQRRGLVERARRALPRADRAARSGSTPSSRSAREEALATARALDAAPGDAPFRGVPIAVKDLTATAGIRTTYSSRAYAELRPGFRHRGRPPDPRGGLRDRRQDEHAGVRDRRVHRVGAQRRDPEPVEHGAHAGRLERRRGGRSRRGARSASRTPPTEAARSGSRRRAAASSG